MEHFDKQAVEDINALTQKAFDQISEAIREADVPMSITGAGSMFRLHLRPEPPTTYREAYQTKEAEALITKMLDYLFYEENLMMINTLACMFSTVMTQKEVDILSEAMLRMFKQFKPEIEQVQ
jgi:glutamate-1-semialdehyde 2,1-aminomutase